VTVLGPVAVGLVVLFTLIALIGFALRSPQPHQLPVGVVGSAPEVAQLSAGFAARAPGAIQLTPYATEAAARAAIDGRSVDAALVLGPRSARLIVAGAAGPAVTGAITGIVGAAFQAQGTAVAVETVHPFAAGDPQGLILFFTILALLIASVVAGSLVGLRDRLRWDARLLMVAGYGLAAGLVGMGTAGWVAGGYGAGFWSAAALVALGGAGVAAAAAAGTRLLGAAGVAVAVLVLVLLDLISSGGPLGTAMLPGFYRWLAPGMPAAQLFSAIRGALFFGGAGVGGPVVVLGAWLAGGLALTGLAELARSPRPEPTPHAAPPAAEPA
jgi:hypothetical protein